MMLVLLSVTLSAAGRALALYQGTSEGISYTQKTTHLQTLKRV